MTDSVAYGGLYYKRRKGFISGRPPPPEYPTPALTSLNYDQGQTDGGGESIVVTGTNLSGATAVTIGGNSATITANTATTVTFTLPAHATGAVTVSVTTLGGTSNTLAFEYWIPTSLSPKIFARAPNYTVGPGTFTDEGSQGDNFTEATNYPAQGSAIGNYSPTVDLDGSDDILTNSTSVATTITGNDLFMWVLFNGDIAAARGTYDGNLLGDSVNAELGLDFNSDGVGFTVLRSGPVYVQSPAIACATGGWHLVRGMIDSAATGVEGMIALDSGSWQTFTVTGGFSSAAPGVFRIGKSYEARWFDGRIAEVGVVNGTVSDANVTKLRKYCQQRYGQSV